MKEAEVQIYTSTEDRALAALHTTEENPVLNEHDIWRNKKQNKTKKNPTCPCRGSNNDYLVIQPIF